MSPLRAVVSRGHIALQSRSSTAHSRFVYVGLREAPFDCTARCAPSRLNALPPVVSTVTVLAPPRLWLLRLHAGATSRRHTPTADLVPKREQLHAVVHGKMPRSSRDRAFQGRSRRQSPHDEAAAEPADLIR